MGSWFTRLIDRVTPWDRGGEVQRRDERRRREEEEARQRSQQTAPTNRGPQQTQQSVLDEGLKVQQPQNIFESLNQNLTLGQNKPEVEQVFKAPQNQVQVQQQPRELERPKQSLINRFRDVFDANTDSDKYRRQEGNKRLQPGEAPKPITLQKPGNIISRTPVVNYIAKGVNTATAQVAEAISTIGQKLAGREMDAATQELKDALASGDRRRIIAATERAKGALARSQDYTRQIDAAKENYGKNDGGLFNVGTLYDEEAARRGIDRDSFGKDLAMPAAVAALDVFTLGKGNAISEGFKQGGRSALGSQIPNIVKAGVGNYGSGDLGARSEGATNEEAIKSGLINSVLGLAPDIALPMLARGFKNTVIPRIFKGRRVTPEIIANEAEDAAVGVAGETASQAARPRPIPVQKNIPVDELGDSLDIPVAVNTPKKPGRPQSPLIRETSNDARVEQFMPTQEEIAARRFNQQPEARPDQKIEGVTPRTPERPFELEEATVAKGQDKVVDDYAAYLRDIGEGNGTQLQSVTENGLDMGYKRTSNNVRFGDTKGKRMTKAMWREEAERQIRAGEADPEAIKAFNDAADPEVQSLLERGDRPDAPVGAPIRVKEVNSIPVNIQDTKVPTNLPETPSTVRVTEANAPMKAKTEAVAASPTVTTPAPLPKEVQNVLDNPKQFNKRQVAAARNQRKLARAMAKTQEDTVAAMERIQNSSPNRVEGQPEGYAPTGEFVTGKRGNVSEKATRATEAQAGAKEMANRSVDDLLDEISTKESLNPGDRRRISAAKENLMKSDPDGFRSSDKYKLLDTLEKSSRSELGRGLGLIPKTIRKVADADTLTGRWERKVGNVLDDPSKMTTEQWREVQGANDAFTVARDKAASLEEQFRKTGSEADYNAWEKAYQEARGADTNAKMTEVKVAQKILKGEKGAKAAETIDKLKKEADVNTMDATSAAMLSGTGTGFRNTFGTELMGLENRILANTRAKVTNKLFGENVGGFDRTGAKYGRKVGVGKWAEDAKRRAEVGGKNPLEWAKNWATTINSGGESSLQSQVSSRLAKYYKNQFDAAGATGKELDLKMRHAMITDPDNMGDIYLNGAMKSSGLTGLFEKGQTIEKAVTDYLGGKFDSKLINGASKIAMRIAVGFPTATTNFLAQSGKRLALGLPSFIETGAKMAKGDKAAAAMAFDRGLKEAGSGASMLGLGAALGAAGAISGPYPSDPDERERWAREGISENSMKIGGAWYPIPQGAGMLGLPLMVGAAIGAEGDSNQSVKDLLNPKSLTKLLPTDQIQGFLNTLSGDESPQALKNMLASTVRAATPVGALLNQIAKSFDPTKNDTTQHGLFQNVLDQVISGIPGLNNMVDIADKKDAEGNPISNPNALELAFGASSDVSKRGEQRSQEIQGELDSSLKKISETGLLDDPNMQGVLKDTGLEAYNKAKSGQPLDESELKALKEGLVKGVSSEGTDTAYLERGQYDTNLNVLRMKRDLMNSDPTVKPSSLKDIDVAIKRGEIYKDGQVPYSMIQKLKDTTVTEWRDMEDEDPKMYQKLWDLDQKLTKAKVSLKSGDLTEGKYYSKTSGRGGRGGSGGRSGGRMSTDFGTLKDAVYSPRVQQYDTIDGKAGSVPIIRKVRPNIVHKITSSG